MLELSHYILIFIAGIAGSMHCVGMCGGFACALKPDPRGHAATVRRHLIYNAGRVTTYCFLGALAGYAGMALVGHDGGNAMISGAQRMLAVISGALMVFIGLQFLGVFKTSAPNLLGAAFAAKALRDLLHADSRAAPLAFGVLNGFLPCPLVYAFAAQAAASGGVAPGVFVMLAFGLGTFPAMLAMGGIGLWIRNAPRAAGVAFMVPAGHLKAGAAAGLRTDWRVFGIRIAGAFIVLLGIITLARGLLPLAAHIH